MMAGSNHFIGMDGFCWFFGRVVDRHDPLCLGRVRVRVFGIHPEDENIVPNSDLPWAMPIQDIGSAGVFGIGKSPVGPIEGTIVFGFFADGRDCQIPFVLGTVATGAAHFVLSTVDTVKTLLESTKPVESLGQLSKAFAVKAGPIGTRLMKDLNIQDFQAAAILGNLGLESSGVQPDLREGGAKGPCWEYGTSLKGYGWAQWTNPKNVKSGSKGRMDKFIDFVKENFNGYDITKFAAIDDHNYAFLIYELTKGEKKASLAALKNTTTLTDATTVFMNKFEAPNAAYAHLDRRLNYAEQALASMKGTSVPTRSTGKNITGG